MKKAFLILAVLAISLFALLPFYEMLIMGTYYTDQLYTGIKLLPGTYLMENLKNILKHDFFLFYKNSLTVTMVNTVMGVTISTLAGYAFAKYRFKGQGVLFFIVISALAIPPQLGLVGFVIEMRSLGWSNSLLPLMISGVANPFGVFWMRQYIQGAVPNEIVESGRIDGCGDVLTLVKIVLPLSKASLATISLFYAVQHWNEFLHATIYINTDSKWPLQVVLRNIIDMLANDLNNSGEVFMNPENFKMATIVITVLPIMCVYPFLQKYFTQGVMMGSVKG